MRTRNQITKLLNFARRKKSFTVDSYHKHSNISKTNIKPVIQYLLLNGELSKVKMARSGYKGSGGSTIALYSITALGKKNCNIRVKLNSIKLTSPQQLSSL